MYCSLTLHYDVHISQFQYLKDLVDTNTPPPPPNPQPQPHHHHHHHLYPLSALISELLPVYSLIYNNIYD